MARNDIDDLFAEADSMGSSFTEPKQYNEIDSLFDEADRLEPITNFKRSVRRERETFQETGQVRSTDTLRAATPWERVMSKVPKVSAAIDYTREKTEGLGEGLKELFLGTPQHLLRESVTAFHSAVRGGDETAEKDKVDSFIDASRAISRERMAKPGGEKYMLPGIKVKDARGVAQNLGFTLTSFLAGMGIGLPASFAGPIAGGTGFMTGAGTAAFRMAKDTFLNDLQDLANAESNERNGRDITQEEWQKVVDRYEHVSNKAGLWEAVPEAVGSLFQLGVISKQGKEVVKKGMKKSLATVFKGLLMSQAEEQVGETLTGWGQGQAEYDAGLRDKPPTVPEAFKEQFGSTLLTTGAMNIGGTAVSAGLQREKGVPSDQENIEGVQGSEPLGQEPGGAVQEQVQGETTAGASGVLQEQETGRVEAPETPVEPIAPEIETPELQKVAPPSEMKRVEQAPKETYSFKELNEKVAKQTNDFTDINKTLDLMAQKTTPPSEMKRVEEAPKTELPKAAAEALKEVEELEKLNPNKIEDEVYNEIETIRKVLPKGRVKTFVRKLTGQTKVGKILSMTENDLLKLQLKIEQRASKQGAAFGAAMRQAKIQARVKAHKLTNKIVSSINNVKTAKLPFEYRKQIEDIKAPFDLKRRTSKTLGKRIRIKEFVDKQKEQGNEVHINESVLDMIEKTPLNDMTLTDLYFVNDAIQKLVHQGRVKNKLIAAKDKRDFTQIVNSIVGQITQGKGTVEKGTFETHLEEANKIFLSQGKEAADAYIAMHLRPERITNLLDNFERGGQVTEIMFNTLLNSERKNNKNATESLNQIKEIHKDIDMGQAMRKKVDVGRFKGVTRDNLYDIYAHSFNEGNRRHLFGSGITYSDLEAIEKELTDKEKSAIRKMHEFYDKVQHPALSQVYMELTGTPLPKEENYFPIQNLENVTSNKAIEQDLMQRHYVRKAGVEKGQTISRVKSKKGFTKFSYFETIMKNWQDVEHYKAYAKEIRDVSKLLYNPQVKKAIEQKHGKAIYKELDKWLKDVSYGGEQKTNDALSRTLRFFRTNFVTNVLGFNVITMSKQPVSFLQGVGFIGERAALDGVKRFIVNPIKSREFMESKDPGMKERSKGVEREMREIVSGGGVKKFFGQSGKYQKAREASMKPIQITDNATVTSLWNGAYWDVIKTGKIEGKKVKGDLDKAAVEWASEAIRKTQPMSGVLHLAGAFRAGEIMKAYTMFKNQPNQNFNLAYETYKKFGRKDSSSIRNSIYYVLAPAFLMGLIIRKGLPEEPKEYILDMANQLTGGFVLIGGIVNDILNGLGGKWTPGLRTVTPIPFTSYEDFVKIFTSKKPETRMKYGLRFLGKISGAPGYTQIERAIEGRPLGGKNKKEKIKGTLLMNGHFCQDHTDMVKSLGNIEGGIGDIRDRLKEVCDRLDQNFNHFNKHVNESFVARAQMGSLRTEIENLKASKKEGQVRTSLIVAVVAGTPGIAMLLLKIIEAVVK